MRRIKILQRYYKRRYMTAYSMAAHNFMTQNAAILGLCFLFGFTWSLYAPSPTARLVEQATAQLGHNIVRNFLIEADSHEDLNDIFAQQSYELQAVAGGDAVPPVFLSRLPKDIAAIHSPKDKKDLFIRSVLPLVLLVNEQISKQREKLLELDAKIASRQPIGLDETRYLEQLASEYGLNGVDMDELKRRVDVIPPSLAIAQAAEESGWGTSRFAQSGNALYGQQIFSPNGGMLPEDRAQGRGHYVRAFNSLYETVLSYMRNLNSHRSYAAFRAVREDLRQENRNISGHRLAETLIAYSERRGAYVKTLQSIMRINDLHRLDKARLDLAEDDVFRLARNT